MIWIFNWWLRVYYSRCRNFDLKNLWPACVSNTSTIEKARTAFALHCFYDKAWTVLGDDEIERIILELQP